MYLLYLVQQHHHMKRILSGKNGQFIPISAMVLFTMSVFLVAVVNIYTVTRAKLQVQNLADAAALNLASQQAQVFNLVADKNEWLNHMMEGVKSPNEDGGPDCSLFSAKNATLIPGISCVENDDRTGLARGDAITATDIKKASSRNYRGPNDAAFKRHIFSSRGGAINYGLILHTVNQAQKLFIQAYNSFLGAPNPAAGGASSSNATPRNFTALLKKDIPALRDPNIRLVAWNSSGKEEEARHSLASSFTPGEESELKAKMEPLQFEVERDLQTRYLMTNKDVNKPDGWIVGATFGQLLYGCIPQDWVNKDASYKRCGPLNGQDPAKIGWLKPIAMPTLKVGRGSPQVGVGVMIQKKITLPVLGSKTVSATSKAYIVGTAGSEFHPTYWVKLGK